MSANRDLAKALTAALQPLYLLGGEDPLLVQEARDALRQKAREAGFSEYSLYSAQRGLDWSQFTADTGNASLFGDRKIIDLRLDLDNMPARERDAARQHLLDYAQRPDTDAVLIVSTGRLTKKEQQTSWCKQALQVGPLIQLWPLKAAEFPGWLQARARTAGLELDRDALNLLAERTEGNLLAAAQEIRKLALLCEQGQVDAATVLASVGDSARYSSFQLIDTALEGKPREAWRSLQGLRGEGAEPLALLWALTRDLRLLLQIGAESRQSGTAAALSRLHVPTPRHRLLSQALERLPRPLLWRNLAALSDIDQAAKGMNNQDAWLLLEARILELAGSRR